MDRNEANRPQRRTALIGLDLARYNIDIAALSETLLADEGKLCEEALAIHYSGAAEEMKNEERLVFWFVVKISLIEKLLEPSNGINDRLIKMRLSYLKNTSLLSAAMPLQ